MNPGAIPKGVVSSATHPSIRTQLNWLPTPSSEASTVMVYVRFVNTLRAPVLIGVTTGEPD